MGEDTEYKADYQLPPARPPDPPPPRKRSWKSWFIGGKFAPYRIWSLTILDHVFPILCLPLLIAYVDIDSFHRFQPATDKTFYTVFLPPIIALVIGVARVLCTMDGSKGTRLWWRNTYNLGAAVIGIAVLVVLYWKPHPGALYVLSGGLDRTEGKIVRLKMHEFISRETSYRGRREETSYAVVSFADHPEMRFEINLGRLVIPVSHGIHHDLQARWHPGALGLSWIDQNSLEVLADIYKLEFEGESQRFQRFAELKGKHIVLVGVGRCMPDSTENVFERLADLANGGGAVVVRFKTSFSFTCDRNQQVVAEPWSFGRDRFPLMARYSTDRFLEFVLLKRGEHLDPLDSVVVDPNGRLALYEDLAKPDKLRRLIATVSPR